MTRAFFYDTWAFVAMADERDAGHAAATELDLQLERKGYAAVTTDYILDETVTHLSREATPGVAIEFLEGFLARVEASEIQLVEINAERRSKAVALFKRLAPDARQLSFTDTTSFAVMHELAIELAFTADRHFHRAGRGVRPMLKKHARGFSSEALG